MLFKILIQRLFGRCAITAAPDFAGIPFFCRVEPLWHKGNFKRSKGNYYGAKPD